MGKGVRVMRGKEYEDGGREVDGWVQECGRIQ
jgi:hypothetical protein